jgi:hypothetical protein
VARPGRTLAVVALGVLGTLVTGGATTPSPSAPALVQPEVQEIGLLFVQAAGAGTFEPADGGSGHRLTLSGVTPQVVWFSDRPERQSGHIPLHEFVDAWAGYGFADDPPNAALSVLGADDGVDMVVVELGTPEYDPATGTIHYPVTLLDEATGNLSHLASDLDAGVADSFGTASLFIDDATWKIVMGCAVHPHTVCRDHYWRGVDLHDSDLRYADLVQSLMSDVNLSGANLTGADLTRVDLSGANLRDANFSEAILLHADMEGADVTGASFCMAVMPDGSYYQQRQEGGSGCGMRS